MYHCVKHGVADVLLNVVYVPFVCSTCVWLHWSHIKYFPVMGPNLSKEQAQPLKRSTDIALKYYLRPLTIRSRWYWRKSFLMLDITLKYHLTPQKIRSRWYLKEIIASSTVRAVSIIEAIVARIPLFITSYIVEITLFIKWAHHCANKLLI